MKLLRYTSLALMLALSACTKKDDAVDNTFTNRLTFIIDDNKFNFSAFSTALGRTNYKNQLLNDGPYTVLIPDNNAFITAGYSTDQSVLKESSSVLSNLVAYHIVYGTWELNKLPFKFNQELTAISGSKLYVTRWVKDKDTVTTINGAPVLSSNLQASNGLIQVINNVLQPMLHARTGEVISGDTSLTFLNVALQQSGLRDQFYNDDVYTFFAPTNAAFIKAGYPSADSISRTSPETLKALLQYHFFAGRKFIYDYILTTDNTAQTTQAMNNGNALKISLVKSGIKYTGITMAGEGNKTAAQLVKSNVMAGNGVVHIIDQVLNENR
ncbi:fasciclin domain-containing protein [Chitinophaga sp. Cy-1792]|uniref:fasciclin domain-containing protein n=1 Tax=Chitinophaga sp. Cy-1792 TaxID=2608339 RepID=UPI00142490EC|nr:fasciclin domain-containing protein [Chitinophaga sp. Cy-1792]NIG56740.1 fasciclin domain-containing protein [Chitinophaga sp. Cy-1792]